METKSGTVTFPPFKGSGPRTMVSDLHFEKAVSSSIVMLTGFDVRFTPEEGDHSLGRLIIEVSSNILSPTVVRVNVVYGLRDWTEEWDDKYDAIISFSVLGW